MKSSSSLSLANNSNKKLSLTLTVSTVKKTASASQEFGLEINPLELTFGPQV